MPGTSRQAARVYEVSPLGSCSFHFRKIHISNMDLMKLNVFSALLTGVLSWHQLQYFCLYFTDDFEDWGESVIK